MACVCVCVMSCVHVCESVSMCVCACMFVHLSALMHMCLFVCVCACEAVAPISPRGRDAGSRADLQAPIHGSCSPLFPGEKRKFLPPTSRNNPKFEELQKVRQPSLTIFLWRRLFIFLGWGPWAIPSPTSSWWVAVPQAPGRPVEWKDIYLHERIFIERRLCVFLYGIPARLMAVERGVMSPASQGADSKAWRSDLTHGEHTVASDRAGFGPRSRIPGAIDG